MTAVEWLVEQIKNDQNQKALSASEWMQVIKEAKQMEKEQIQKAFSDGQELPISNPLLPHYSSEEYYNEKYSK